jgi:4-hydroxy-4-methyl-2-oxoglutarate aldolase
VDDFVSRLARLDSCAVSDALDKLGLKGSVTGLHRYSSEKRIAGRVLTVKLDRAEGRSNTRHLCTAAIEAASPGDIIVVEQRTGLDAACWGGNLTIGAQVRGVAGVIVEGPARDIDDSRKLDFPVFARTHTARTARGRILEVETGGPVEVGDVIVKPGDYAIADGSAVVFVAAGEIERVLETAEAIMTREEAMAQALREGKPISQVMGANYEHMLKGQGS